MPQLDVFMSESDLEQVMDALFAAGCVIVPDEPSEQPRVHEIDNLRLFRTWRREKKTRLFFAVSNEWTVAPFEWGEIEKPAHKQFFIRQKSGGPTLDIFAPPALRSSNGRGTLPHGFIGHHSSFWNSLTKQNEKPPDALKAMHNMLSKQLRSGADQVKGKQRTYLVARGAKEMIRAGYSLGPPFDV